MNATQALAQARKRWGKTAGVKDYGKNRPSSPERRAAAHARVAELRAYLPPAGQRTKAQKDELQMEVYDAMHYRYNVGYVALGMFFAVEGQGDSWAHALEEADKRAARASGTAKAA